MSVPIIINVMTQIVPCPHNKQTTQQMKLSQKKLTILMIFLARRKYPIVAGGRLRSPCFRQNPRLML